MPRGIPNPKNIKRHYFLVSGEVEFTDANPTPMMAKVNGVFVSKSDKITVKDLGQIQRTLQLNFFNKYLKNHPSPPSVTDTVISTFIHLGSFTQDEFHNDEELAKTDEKKPELKAVVDDLKPEATLPATEAPKAEETKPVETPVVVPETKPEAVAVTPESVKQPLVEVKAETPVPAPVEVPKTA